MCCFKESRYNLNKVALRHPPVFWPRKHAFGIFRMEKRNKSSGDLRKMKLKGKLNSYNVSFYQVLQANFYLKKFFFVLCIKVKLGSEGGHATLRTRRRKTARHSIVFKASRDYLRLTDLPKKYRDGCFKIPYICDKMDCFTKYCRTQSTTSSTE